MSAFAVAKEILGDMPLSSDQLAQLRALDREYHQRLFGLMYSEVPAGAAPGARVPRALTEVERGELRRMLEEGIRALIASGGRAP